MHPFPWLWLTKPCFQTLASCYTSQQIPCNSKHLTLTCIWSFQTLHPHSPNVSTNLTYTNSESMQSSDSQLPNSDWGIIDICCHSVGPSHMVVLWILLWLTHYDFYYQQGIEQHLSGNYHFKHSWHHPSIKTFHCQHPLHKFSGPCPGTSDNPIPLVEKTLEYPRTTLSRSQSFPSTDLLKITSR